MQISMNYTPIDNNGKDYYEMIFSNINIDNIIEKYTDFVKNNNVMLKEFKLEKLNSLKSNDNIYNYIKFSIKHFINIIVDIIINSKDSEEYKNNITNKFINEVNTSILVIDKIDSDEYQKKCQHMIIDILTFTTNNILSLGSQIN
jgi:hypothetical protein